MSESAAGRRLRVVGIGAGAGIFNSHLRGIAAVGGIDVVGVQDLSLERIQSIAERAGCPAFQDVGALLQHGRDRGADLAVITTPHPFHAELAIRCLEAGLDVLTEKPMAVEVAEADRMVAAAERTGRQLTVVFQYRLRSEVIAARRAVQEGAIGVIQRVDLLATWPRRKGYFEVAPWRGTWNGEGGGVLINQGQHDLDVLEFVVGHPSRVMAWHRTQLHAIETEDTISAMAEWPNGAHGFIHISTAEFDEEQRLEITGTGGRLRLTKFRLELIRNDVDMRDHAVSSGNAYEPLPTLAPEIVEGADVSHADVYRELLDARANGRPAAATGASALQTLELTNALTYSAHSGREARLPLDRAGYGELLRSLRAGSGPRR